LPREVGVRPRDRRERLPHTRRRGARCPQGGRQLHESLRRDRRHDRGLAAEVAVEDGLAVLDLGGEAAGRDGFPAFGLRELAGRANDQLLALRAFALATVSWRHAVTLAPLGFLAPIC